MTSSRAGMTAEIWFKDPNKRAPQPFDAAQLAQDCVDACLAFGLEEAEAGAGGVGYAGDSS